MSLKIVSNKLLLQNTIDSLWYQVYITVVDGIPYLTEGQEAVDVPILNDYNTYAVLRTTTGDYFKFQLQTHEAIIHYFIQEIDPTSSNRIILRADDNSFYEIKVVLNEFDGQFYVQIVPISSSTFVEQCAPWKLISGVDVCTTRSISPVNAKCEREILVSS